MRVELGPHGPHLTATPPRRPPGEHRVRVRIELAGVCRSDLKEVAGSRHGVSQFGHEIVGVVAESSLPGLPPGRRVTLDPNVPVARGSGFATEMWAAGAGGPLAAALPVVPDGVDARRLVFSEPLACAQHCLSTAARHLGHGPAGLRVAVLGAGTAGVLIASLALAQGAAVAVGNRGEDRVAFLRERRVLDAPVGALSSLRPDHADLAVVATSFVRPPVLREALRAVAPDGTVLLYGGTAPGDAVPGLDCDLDAVRRAETSTTAYWHGKPVRFAGSYGTTRADFDAAIRALTGPQDATLPVERLVTQESTLPELPALLTAQATGRPLGKTLVRALR